MSLSPDRVIQFLNGLPPTLLLLGELVLCFAAVLVFLRLWGKAGLFAYIALAVIGANVQVLKAVQFGLYPDPVALGTILFASTYLCTDILAEHYGPKAARQGVMVGFGALLFWVVLMVLTLGYSPLTPEQAGDDMAWALPMQDHMAALFTPAPALFAAGMAAYLISQTHDIWLYGLLRKLTGGRWLWLRNNASTMVSGLIDNAIFSVLAWVVFAPEPIGLSALVFTYILGTYALRVAVAALDTPFLYLAKGMVPRVGPLAAAPA